MIDEYVDYFNTEGSRAINEGDWDAYGNLFAEDLVMQTPSLPGISKGREARVSMVKGIMDAFPDGKVEMVRSFGQGDWACLEVRFTGTAAVSDEEETPATVDFPYCIVMRFEDGKVAELNEYYDQLGM